MSPGQSIGSGGLDPASRRNVQDGSAAGFRPGGFFSVGSRNSLLRYAIGKAVLPLVVLWFWIVLRAVYVYQISPVYDYAGLVTNTPDPWADYALLAIALVLSALLPQNPQRASDWAVVVLFMGLITPVLALWPLMLDLEPGQLVAWATFLALAFSVLCVAAIKAPLPLAMFKPPPVDGGGWFWGVVGLAAMIVTLLVIFLGGFTMRLDWLSSYDRRLEARDVMTDRSFGAYVSAVLSGFFIPLTAIGLFAFRKWFLAVPVLCAVAVMFSLDGMKGTMLSPLFIASFTLLLRHSGQYGIPLLAALFPAFTTVSGAANLLNLGELNSYFVRRLFMIPVQVTWAYFDWLFGEGPRWYSGSRLGTIFGVDQEMPSSFLIGVTYFRNADTNANANIFAAAAIESGVLGMVISSCIAGCLLKFLSSVPSNADRRLRVLCATWCAIIWTEGSLQTSMFSNALILFFLLFVFLPKIGSEPQTKAS